MAGRAFLPEPGKALDNRPFRLVELGRPEQGLTAVDETITMNRPGSC